jgi:hypothetical protein
LKRAHLEHERDVVHHVETVIGSTIPLELLPEVDPAETMQLLINRVERQWRYAAAQVNLLKPGVAPNQSRESMDHELWVTWDDNNNLVVTSSYWMHREGELGRLLGDLTDKSIRNGLAERRARVAEAQLQIMGAALQAACEQIGLPQTKVRQLGAALRTEIEVAEGVYVEAAA